MTPRPTPRSPAPPAPTAPKPHPPSTPPSPRAQRRPPRRSRRRTTPRATRSTSPSAPRPPGSADRSPAVKRTRAPTSRSGRTASSCSRTNKRMPTGSWARSVAAYIDAQHLLIPGVPADRLRARRLRPRTPKRQRPSSTSSRRATVRLDRTVAATVAAVDVAATVADADAAKVGGVDAVRAVVAGSGAEGAARRIRASTPTTRARSRACRRALSLRTTANERRVGMRFRGFRHE